MTRPEELASDCLAHPSLPWLSKLSAKRRRQGESSRPPPRAGIETLPKWLLCVPLVAQWLWLGVRHRSLTLPSSVNPAIENGGLAGESKFAYLRGIGTEHPDFVARTLQVTPGEDASGVRREAGMRFPIVAKPDVGWCGYGVRRIDDEAQLAAYAASFPKDAAYLLQALIDAPGEAGLLYARHPGEAAGRLLGVALRHRPQVSGDGASTVRQLAERDIRLAGMDIAAEVGARVPGAGEVVVLTTVASLRTGGRYEDGERLMSAALAARVDAGCALDGRLQLRPLRCEVRRRSPPTRRPLQDHGDQRRRFRGDPVLGPKLHDAPDLRRRVQEAVFSVRVGRGMAGPGSQAGRRAVLGPIVAQAAKSDTAVSHIELNRARDAGHRFRRGGVRASGASEAVTDRLGPKSTRSARPGGRAPARGRFLPLGWRRPRQAGCSPSRSRTTPTSRSSAAPAHGGSARDRPLRLRHAFARCLSIMPG